MLNYSITIPYALASPKQFRHFPCRCTRAYAILKRRNPICQFPGDTRSLTTTGRSVVQKPSPQWLTIGPHDLLCCFLTAKEIGGKPAQSRDFAEGCSEGRTVLVRNAVNLASQIIQFLCHGVPSENHRVVMPRCRVWSAVVLARRKRASSYMYYSTAYPSCIAYG